MAASLRFDPTRRAMTTQAPTYTYAEERDSAFIDELIRISEQKRTAALGSNYFEFAREFFQFRPSTWAPQMEAQIKLRMPELLTMIMEESYELTEPEPLFFVTREGSREQDREKALKTNWRATRAQSQLFLAELWAMMCHTGFIQITTDATAPRTVRALARNPQNVYPDPFQPDWRDWEYVLVRVPTAPDEIVRSFPALGPRLPGILAENQRQMYSEARTGGMIGSGPEAIELPPGAMQSVTVGRPPGASDYLTVDYLYIKDESRETVMREVAGSKAAGSLLPPPKSIPRFPTGRLIVRVEKLKAFDGMNQFRRFPFIPVFAMPPLYGLWGTPPLQLYIQMQHLAESMMSQNAENVIRMNYGYRVYQDGAILNPEALDRLGANIRVKTADDVSRVLKIIYAQQFSGEQNAFPNEIIQHMRQLFGRNEARSGMTGQGNISPGLLDEGIAQAQAITRMRSGLLGDAVQEVGRLTFETMVDYLDNTILVDSLNGQFMTAPWQGVPLDKIGGWNVNMDAASIRPISAGALKRLALPLINLGLPIDIALQWLQVPDAEAIGERIRQEKQQQMMMQALMGLQKQQKGRGKS